MNISDFIELFSFYMTKYDQALKLLNLFLIDYIYEKSFVTTENTIQIKHHLHKLYSHIYHIIFKVPLW